MKQKHILLKLWALLLCMIVGGVGSASAEDKTITLDYNSFGLTTTYAEKTATADGYSFTVNQGYKGSENTIQMNSSKGSGILYNTTAIPGLKSITINVSSGSKTYTITTGTSEKPTANSQTGTSTGTYNAVTGDTYFQLKVSGASYFSSVVITYDDSNSGGNSELTVSDLALAEAPVELSFDLYNNSSAQTISYTTSSTGAVTVSESDYVSCVVDETAKTITVTPTAVTPNAQTITVTQAADDTYAEGTATFTVTITDTTPLPTHIVTFSVNGVTSTQGFEEGAAISFPENPADIEGKVFVGWTTEAISGTTDTAPTFVNSATMGESDITYYAVFATKAEGGSTEVIDELYRSTTGITGTSYSAWSGKAGTSGAVYAGQSAGGNSSIQLRSTNPSGIVTTKSGGTAKKITITWNDSTDDARTLDIYGSNKAYTGSANLYDGSVWGASIGSINKKTDTEYTFTTDYQYVGVRSKSGAMYIDKIVITWATGAPDTFSGYCTTVAADTRLDPEFSFAQSEQTVEWTAKDNYSVQSVSTTLAALPEPISWTSSNEEVATFNTTNGAIDIVGLGQTTIKASFAGDENYKKSEATYTLTVQDSREVLTLSFNPATLTLNVGEETGLPVLNGNSGNGAVTYESSNNEIAFVGDGVTAAQKVFAGQTEGTATIIATVAETSTHKGGTATFTVTVTDPNRKGSLGNPYSVAEAIENTPSTGVYVKGIVSKFTNTGVYTDQYHRYSISDDGTRQSDELLIFNGKGLNNVAFASDDDVQIGDIVVIYGDLSLYNSTKEMTAGNYIVSLKRKAEAGLAYETTAFETFPGDEEFVTPTLTNPNQLAVTYSSDNDNVAVVDETTGEVVLGDAEGTATITATFAGNDSYWAGTASYTITLAKLAAGLAFEETSFEVRANADFTAPTLTNPNQLTVTYSSTNEDVALVDETTGEVIIGEAGEAIITAFFAGNTKFNAASASYTITVVAGKLTAEITLAVESVSMNAGTEKVLSALYTTNSDGVVSYESSDDSFVAIADGKLVAVQPTTEPITITINMAESDSYNAVSATLPVTITQLADVAAYTPVSGYKRVTDASTLKQGDQLVVLGYTSNGYAYAMSEQNNNNRKAEGVTETDGVITWNTTTVQEINLEGETGAWYFNVGDDLYLYASSNSSNQLKSASKETVGDNGKATITIGENGTATVKFQGKNSRNLLRYNSQSSLFACYSSGQDDIYLYRLESPEITISSAQWRTLVSTKNIQFPEEVKAYIVTSVGEDVTMKRVRKVKAGEPVVLNAVEGSYAVTVIADGEYEDTEANLLQVSTQSEGENVYVLANKTQGVGFYKWTGGWLGKGRVYLPSANGTNARSFIGFNLDETTAISSLQSDKKSVEGIYSLSGQRVLQPKKGGLYIVNGKKMVIK